MRFLPLNEADWQVFLAWAGAERWRVPFQEQRLFQNQWRHHFFVLKENGQALGFVSAVGYRESGWIGNLLVGPTLRGLGYGAALFDFAVDFLHQTSLKRIWLTASAEGMPIYQRRGFISVDRVERWRGIGLGCGDLEHLELLEELIDVDRRCWGESRAPLLRSLADDGEICCQGSAWGLLQTGLGDWQLGPWLAPEPCPRSNRLLLTSALGKTPAGRSLVADVLVSADLELLLRNAGFVVIASNELMCLCDRPVRLQGVVGLASLGSIG